MKTFFFHLMPYADLDLSYTDRHNSAWVTLPNSYFDPAVGEKLYARYIGELELADRLGFDGICVNEHHQTAYGLMPAPNLIAAALARSTKQAKIAILGRALPLVSNPVAVAEEFAMLDHLSGGRIITGFVRGIGTEYFASGVNPTHSHGRYYEAHELFCARGPRSGRSATTGAITSSTTSISGRVRCSSRIRRSGSPRKAAPRRSNGAPRPSANTPICRPSAR
jgi:Luciferase-like monooxygenase